MSYTLTYSIGTLTVVDTTLNTQTSLALPGRNYTGYGQPVDQNQLSMLENWASNTSGPYAPIPGQTWYDSSNVAFKVNTSTNVSPTWKEVAFEGTAATFTSVITPILTTGSNSTAGVITGDWTLSTGSTLTATYADLAERFWADAEYDEGTVVELGGEHEITAVRQDCSDRVFGVISTSAGMIMNGAAGNDVTHPKIAMTGRVPVKVVGTVKKGDRLVSAGDGIARRGEVGEVTPFTNIGRALEDKTTETVAKVLAAVTAKV